ncbi:MAG: methyltransferase domain-containing protein [Desulfuromonadales bacterium]|nr:methyltransferase domain-containing protein [Desulfuromonadales bacterium]
MSRLKGLFRRDVRNEDLFAFIEKNKRSPREYVSKQFFEYDADKTCGSLFLYKCDLKDMALLPDGFVDGVVSISALEHNDHKDFEKCIDEILRVTKPSGWLLATVSAAQSEDWFHAPSKGWCYSEATLKQLFQLSESVESNFSQKKLFFEQLRSEGNNLHKRLASVYSQSGENGMPWGKWKPTYIPVGILKVKA